MRNTDNGFVVLDMFSGAGGLSEGFFRTGYKFITHIEKDLYASMTLETRSAYHALKMNGMEDHYMSYIAGEISREDLLDESKYYMNNISSGNITSEISCSSRDKLISEIENRQAKLKLKNVDVLIGGPPCQAYSLVGRSRDPQNMRNDSRNDLYLHYLDFLKHFDPSIFVFENVPGIISAKGGFIYKKFLKTVDEMGYTVNDKVLNSKAFFVLQNRNRLIIIGWKSDYGLEYPSFAPIEHDYTISSLLDDLPSLNPGEGEEGPQDYHGPPTEYLKKSGLRSEQDILIQHRARRHNERDRDIYRRAIDKWNKENARIKYDELPEDLKTHKNRNSFRDRYKVVAADLKYSQSIMAHLSQDGHYYIHPDINQARSLTAREAARIQSFPDNFKFEGSRKSQYRQIGNAVPPLMAEGIAREIKKMLEKI
ncbi:MAG TPA: DNA cytosine methyltransferase [Cyclobacteriaceae bacterium]|nr:DNA cytosine methyltransferase [Cyclobacteriaceae bacterium]